MLPWLLKNPALSAALGGCLVLAGLLGVSRVQLSGAREDGATAAKAYAELAFDNAQAALASERAARATEQRQREALAGVAATYEGKLTDAQEAAARDLAALRAGNLRLRDHWQGCLSTADLAAAAERGARADELAELRRESAARIVRVGAECDARVSALQSAIRVMQGETQ